MMTVHDMSPTVLVVEDSWYMQELLRDTLEAWGYRVLATDSVGGAAGIVNLHKPDIALMDIVLPDLDGICGTMALRALDPYLEVVVVSGWVTSDMRARAIRVGAADFLAKPFVEEQLREAVNNALRRKVDRHENCCITG